jgi:hypothetical protein
MMSISEIILILNKFIRACGAMDVFSSDSWIHWLITGIITGVIIANKNSLKDIQNPFLGCGNSQDSQRLGILKLGLTSLINLQLSGNFLLFCIESAACCDQLAAL